MPSGVYDRLPPEIPQYIREHASAELTISELWQNVRRDLKVDIKREYVRGRIRREHLPFKNGHRHNILLTDEQAEKMIEIIPGRSSLEVSRIMREQYGVEISTSQVRGWKKNHKTPSGFDTRFRPGHPSETKGKNWNEFLTPEQQERLKQTQFKKGHIPQNRREIGNIKERSDGYLWIKIQDGHQNANWVQYHRWVYEQEHGPIPEGFRVYFLDGDRRNCRIENLELVSEGVAATAAKFYGLTKDAEINKAILKAAALKVALTKAQERVKK